MIGFDAAPRYPRLISRLTGDEEITPPGLTLEDDRPEWAYLKGEKLWTSGPQFVAANVANVSCIEARYAQLTASPRMIAVITGIKVCGVNVVAADRYQLTHDGAAAATPATGFLRDTRWALQQRSTLQFNILNANPSVSGDILDEVSAEVTGKDLFFSVVPLILHQTPPGQTAERYAVFSVAINKALRVMWWGYERLVRPEEVDLG